MDLSLRIFFLSIIIISNLTPPLVDAKTPIKKFKKEIKLINDHRIKVQIVNGWLVAERTDSKKELLWRIPICSADFSQKPGIEVGEQKISIRIEEKNYSLFTEIDGLLYLFLRGNIEGPWDSFHAQFDPREYGLRFSNSVGGSSQESWTIWEKADWYYFAVGGKVFPYVGAIFRMTHKALNQNRIEQFSSVQEISFFWDEAEVYFDGNFLFVKQISEIDSQRRLKQVQQK